MKIKKSTLYLIVGVLVIAGVGSVAYPMLFPDPRVELAKCLTENGATFFGAFWCPHCADQKDKFGERAVKELPYVECSLPDRSGSTQICREKGIDSYPLWEFADGSTEGGSQELAKLAAKAGCPWNP